MSTGSAILHPSPLYAICDAEACARAGWSLVDHATACLTGGARLLQVRAKQADAGWLLDCTAQIVELARSAGDAQVIVNDRADIALLTAADGIHVGQDDLPVTAVRAILGDKVVVGYSTHTYLQLERAVVEPLSYLAIGPVFTTGTKDTGYAPVGLSRVSEAAKAAAPQRRPVVAIGGITLERARAVLDAGADAVAVIGDLLATGDPEARVREYLKRLAG